MVVVVRLELKVKNRFSVVTPAIASSSYIIIYLF